MRSSATTTSSTTSSAGDGTTGIGTDTATGAAPQGTCFCRAEIKPDGMKATVKPVKWVSVGLQDFIPVTRNSRNSRELRRTHVSRASAYVQADKYPTLRDQRARGHHQKPDRPNFHPLLTLSGHVVRFQDRQCTFRTGSAFSGHAVRRAHGFTPLVRSQRGSPGLCGVIEVVLSWFLVASPGRARAPRQIPS